MAEHEFKTLVFLDLATALKQANFKFFDVNNLNSWNVIPADKVLAADHFHPDYRSWEVIVWEPNGKNYKFNVVWQTLASCFFYLLLDCGNPDCDKQWIGFWWKKNGSKAKYPGVHHYFNLDGKEHLKECDNLFTIPSKSILITKVTFPTNALNHFLQLWRQGFSISDADTLTGKEFKKEESGVW